MENNELQHHGILGMKWGIRRFQNPDGSLTYEGLKRYDNGLNTQEELFKRGRQKHIRAQVLAQTVGRVVNLIDTAVMIEVGNFITKKIANKPAKDMVSQYSEKGEKYLQEKEEKHNKPGK